MIFILIIVALIYCAMPWFVEIIAWIINMFLPDTIPLVDELLMFVPIVLKIKKIVLIKRILEQYWKLILVFVILVVVTIVYFIVA